MSPRAQQPFRHLFVVLFVHKTLLWKPEPREKCELYSIDSSVLLCAVLSARQYFADQEISPRAEGGLTDPVDGSMIRAPQAAPLRFSSTMRSACCAISAGLTARVGTKYSFRDAFNPLTNWYDPDVLGIDLGITMLMAENHRTGFVWEQFMKNPEAAKTMQLADFH